MGKEAVIEGLASISSRIACFVECKDGFIPFFIPKFVPKLSSVQTSVLKSVFGNGIIVLNKSPSISSER